ncbi:MAG: aminotransferase class IV [Ruminiclostridium sp.]
MNKFVVDEGYYFGLGVFETIAIEESHPLFLDRHLKRMSDAIKYFEIENTTYKEQVNKHQILHYIHINNIRHGCLKIVVSKENIIYTHRDNTYTAQDYRRGFSVRLSKVLRNETSTLTFYKTINYLDNILEKRAANKMGIDEAVFLNTRGQLTEGTVSNIFFIKDNRIITPRLECGLLNGTIRSYMLEHYDVVEDIIVMEDIIGFDEMFLTNSLFGIMPVNQFEGRMFQSREKGKRYLNEYIKHCKEYVKQVIHSY